MSDVIKLGVVGVGHLGSQHARIYSELAKRSNGQCQFVGIFDTDKIKVRALAEKVGGGVFETAEEMAKFVDAVSIATPTETHASVARIFLAQGRHLLVEKPITNNVAEAEELVALARARKCVLQVGHVERFNPVMRYLNEVLAEARFIEVHRLSPYPGRSTDIGVVLDLMIHDFDVVLSLVQSPLAAVDAVGIPVLSVSGRHRQRPVEIRQRLRCQHHRQPRVGRTDAQDPHLRPDRPWRRLYFAGLHETGGRTLSRRRR